MKDGLGIVIEDGDQLRMPALPSEGPMETVTVVAIHSAVLTAQSQGQGPMVKLVVTQRREIMIPAQIPLLENAFIVKKKADVNPEKSSILAP